MFRLDDNAGNTAAALPAPRAASTPAYFQDTLNPGTIVPADWANMIQEELANACVAGGQVLSKTTYNQLALAIAAIAAANAGAPGDMKMTGAVAAPAGWMLCQGQAVSRATYAALYTAIGVAFGAGDGSTTFNVPDMRGEIPRGYDAGRGVDPGRVLGSTQADAIKAHKHIQSVGDGGRPYGGGTVTTGLLGLGPTDLDQGRDYTNDGTDDAGVGGTPNAAGAIGVETRPKNVAVNFIIKF